MKLFDNIDSLDKEKEEYEKNYLSKINRFPYIYLWGISESLDEAIKYFSKNNITIKGIIEMNPDAYNGIYKDIKLIKQDFNNMDSDGAYVITISYFETIKQNILNNYKDMDKNLFMFDGYFLENRDSSYYIENKEQILNCYNNLNDDYSKKLYGALLKYRFIRDYRIIENLYESRKECYLDKVFIENFRDGLYIDAGSYNADFITTLKEKVNIDNSKFYIFEPNKIFYKNIINNLDKKINYKIYNEALCDKVGEIEFMQIPTSTSHLVDKKYNAYKNSINENSIEMVKTTTLDEFLKEERVTGIKIDIEGSESSMLIGAEETIKRDKPIILLSIYHRWDDLFKLQNYVMSLNLNYKFYIRHYSLSIAKTILYCIPSE